MLKRTPEPVAERDRLVAGKFWFPYFRLYAPTEAYFDRSWPLPDIERVD
jgi:hypothetical protein